MPYLHLYFMISEINLISKYSKTCVKRLLQNRQNNDLNNNWSKVLQNAPLGTFCNPFDLQLVITGLEYHLLVFLREIILHRFYYSSFPFSGQRFSSLPSLWCIYTLQLIFITRVNSNVSDFSNRNTCLTAKLLKHGYHYCKLRKTFFQHPIPDAQLLAILI